MGRKKITMVNPEQIVARGWKGMKTRKSVENFAIKQHVNHAYWRAPGNRKILLVDFAHFQESWRDWKKEYGTTSYRPGIPKPKKTPTKRFTKSTTTYKRPTTRKTTSRPKARTRRYAR